MAWVAEDEDVESIDVVEEEPRQRDRQQELRAPRRDDHGGMPPDHEEVEEEEPRKTKGKYLIPGIAAVALVIALLPLGAFVLKSTSGGNQQAANPGMGQQMQQPQPYYQAPPTGQQQPNGGFGPTQPQPTPGAYSRRGQRGARPRDRPASGGRAEFAGDERCHTPSARSGRRLQG